jgi:hypothetical protein
MRRMAKGPQTLHSLILNRQSFAYGPEYRSGYLVTNYERLRTGAFFR